MLFLKRNKIYFVSLVIYLFLATLIFLLLQFRGSYLDLINRKSSLNMNKSGSLCQYHLEGEPVDSGGEYIKIRFSCKDGLFSQNTFSKLALEEPTLNSLVNIYKNMFGFPTVDFGDEFICTVNSESTAADFSYILKAKDEVYCVER